MTTPIRVPRPGGACLTCKPPRPNRSWRMAYSGHRTCEDCPGWMLGLLAEIAHRYEQLDPSPGGSSDLESRGAPGFGSRSPASDHVIAMTDIRSSSVAHVWMAGDKRVHQESERPPLSVYAVLLTEVYDVAELRSMSLPDPCFAVRHLTVWLSRHVEWLTRQDTIADFADVLKTLTRQLKPVTGDPQQKPFGRCPNTIDEGESSRSCDGPLYAPRADTSLIHCTACGRDWDNNKNEWKKLGLLLKNTA